MNIEQLKASFPEFVNFFNAFSFGTVSGEEILRSDVSKDVIENRLKRCKLSELRDLPLLVESPIEVQGINYSNVSAFVKDAYLPPVVQMELEENLVPKLKVIRHLSHLINHFLENDERTKLIDLFAKLIAKRKNEINYYFSKIKNYDLAGLDENELAVAFAEMTASSRTLTLSELVNLNHQVKEDSADISELLVRFFP